MASELPPPEIEKAFSDAGAYSTLLPYVEQEIGKLLEGVDRQAAVLLRAVKMDDGAAQQLLIKRQAYMDVLNRIKKGQKKAKAISEGMQKTFGPAVNSIGDY